MNAYGFGAGDRINFSDPMGLCPEWYDGKPCGVSFGGLAVSASWLSGSVSASVGTYVGEGKNGVYLTTSGGGGLGTIPGNTKMSWLPSISIGVERGGSESLASFEGPNGGPAVAGGWGGFGMGGSLSGMGTGNTWEVSMGASTPGVSVVATQSKTTLLTKNDSKPNTPGPVAAQADATSVKKPPAD